MSFATLSNTAARSAEAASFKAAIMANAAPGAIQRSQNRNVHPLQNEIPLTSENTARVGRLWILPKGIGGVVKDRGIFGE